MFPMCLIVFFYLILVILLSRLIAKRLPLLFRQLLHSSRGHEPVLVLRSDQLDVLEVCWLLDGMTLGNPKSKPNLGLRQLLQRDHGGGDGHHHPLGGAGGQESSEGEQVHLHPVDDVTTHQSLSFSLL